MFTNLKSMRLFEERVRKVPDFPKKGVNFVDVSSITVDPTLFHIAVDCMRTPLVSYARTDYTFVGIDSRGFLFAAALAYQEKLGVALARKKGKLPADTICCEYDLEYGKATLEMNKADLAEGRKYIIVDDIIATGGTIGAVEKMIEAAGGTVLCALALYQIKDCAEALSKNIHCPYYVVSEV